MHKLNAGGHLRQEGLIAADDLPACDRAILEQYVVDRADDRGGNLRLLSRDVFMTDVFWPIAYKAQGPALRCLRDEKGWRFLAEASGLSERALRYALNGGKVPHEEARRRLVDLASVTATVTA